MIEPQGLTFSSEAIYIRLGCSIHRQGVLERDQKSLQNWNVQEREERKAYICNMVEIGKCLIMYDPY